MEDKVSIKINILLIIISLLTFNHCNTQRNDAINKIILDKENVASWHMLFFATKKQNYIGSLTAFELQRDFLTTSRYKGYNLDSLLTKAIAGKYLFDCDDMSYCFIPDSLIASDYRQYSFNDFLHKYTKEHGFNDEFIVNTELSANSKLTVVYFLYLKGYYSRFHDYDGVYVTTKGLGNYRLEEEELIDPKLLE